MRKTLAQIPDLILTKMYYLQGRPYLPHYTEPVYVPPGYTNTSHQQPMTEEALIDAGARVDYYPLWSRK